MRTVRKHVKKVAVLLALALVASLAAAQQPTYFVKADMVRGAEGAMGPVCVPNAVFYGGEKVVFRVVVIDATTGEQLTPEQVAERGLSARVNIDGVEPFDMFYLAPGEAEEEGEGPPPGSEFFRGPWVIPVDFAPGMYAWTIDVTDNEGNTASFEPIGAAAGLPSLLVQPPGQ